MTEQQWLDVFRIRCRSKHGIGVSFVDLKLCGVALEEDPARYAAMNADVETAPFSSTKKRKKEKTDDQEDLQPLPQQPHRQV